MRSTTNHTPPTLLSLLSLQQSLLKLAQLAQRSAHTAPPAMAGIMVEHDGGDVRRMAARATSLKAEAQKQLSADRQELTSQTADTMDSQDYLNDSSDNEHLPVV